MIIFVLNSIVMVIFKNQQSKCVLFCSQWNTNNNNILSEKILKLGILYEFFPNKMPVQYQ